MMNRQIRIPREATRLVQFELSCGGELAYTCILFEYKPITNRPGRYYFKIYQHIGESVVISSSYSIDPRTARNLAWAKLGVTPERAKKLGQVLDVDFIFGEIDELTLV
jgi:hypothetical protein